MPVSFTPVSGAAEQVPLERGAAPAAFFTPLRSAPHPDSYRHLLQVSPCVPDGEACRVELLEYEGPRREGAILSRVGSCALPVAAARGLYTRVRLLSLEGVAEALLSARPPSPPVSARGPTIRVQGVQLTPTTVDALKWLTSWLKAQGTASVGRNAALDLAIQEAAQSRGWSAPAESEQSPDGASSLP